VGDHKVVLVRREGVTGGTYHRGPRLRDDVKQDFVFDHAKHSTGFAAREFKGEEDALEWLKA